MVVNLEQYQPQNSKVFSGRESANDVRKKLNLDEEDKKSRILTIQIPEDTFSINASYFLELFGASVRTLGEKKFREKYVFICTNIIRRSIDDGIERALKSSNILKQK
jgi:hypothetical protein